MLKLHFNHINNEEIDTQTLKDLRYEILSYLYSGEGDFFYNEGFIDGEPIYEWENHEKNMKHISDVFCNILFELTVEIHHEKKFWKKYFLNGRMQKCKGRLEIIYPNFDENQLK